MTISDLLAKFNIKYESLNHEEQTTLEGWLKKLSEKEIGVSDIKAYIKQMIRAVENDLVDCNIKKNVFLKGRLKNYILLEAFLESPEKAREAIESQLKNIK